MYVHRNAEPAFPVLFAADTSPSARMNGALKEIQGGLQLLAQEVTSDKMLGRLFDIAVTAFDGMEVVTVVPFTLALDFQPPVLPVGVQTPLLQQVCHAVETVGAHCAAVQAENDRDLRSSWVFVATDGQAGDRRFLSQARHASQVVAPDHNIEIFYLACGNNPDMKLLSQLAQPGRGPRLMRSVSSFLPFFQWLFQSIREKSMSQAGQQFLLPATDAWAVQGLLGYDDLSGTG